VTRRLFESRKLGKAARVLFWVASVSVLRLVVKGNALYECLCILGRLLLQGRSLG